MPLTPDELFAALHVKASPASRWGEPPQMDSPGIYVVALVRHPDRCTPLATPAFDIPAIAAWLTRSPNLRLDGRRPAPAEVAALLTTCWHPEETILYIGKATSLRSRLDQFFKHVLGARSPHKGGHWLKTLAGVDRLWVHPAACGTAAESASLERAALDTFQAHVLAYQEDLHSCPVVATPFANRVHRGRKQRRLVGEHARRE